MDSTQHQQFAERVVRNQQRIFRYIVSLVPNRADADELFQQTCLTLWESWERYDMSLDFVPWACGIAHNHVRNFYRKRQNSQVHLDADVVEMLATRSSQLRQRDDEKITALRACLNELTERNRGIVENYYGGMSVQEIATQRDLSANAIYKLLDRVREALHGCVNLRLAEGAAS
ncbi:MAG: sigma-70 family RNA polymerase sigma factor [Planctomyces sp.]|jgi:RNA polymerase sigma-70 factor (ECF subfamily)